MREGGGLLRPAVGRILVKRMQYIGDLQVKLVDRDECLKPAHIQWSPRYRTSVGRARIKTKCKSCRQMCRRIRDLVRVLLDDSRVRITDQIVVSPCQLLDS